MSGDKLFFVGLFIKLAPPWSTLFLYVFEDIEHSFCYLDRKSVV